MPAMPPIQPQWRPCSAPSKPATVRPHLDNKETRASRATFATLRDVYEAARANAALRPAAVQQLKADKTPTLKPHVGLMLAALGA